MGIQLPPMYWRWAGAVALFALVLLVPWIMLWDWISEFDLVPNMLTDMAQTFSLIFVSMVLGHRYIRRRVERLETDSDSPE